MSRFGDDKVLTLVAMLCKERIPCSILVSCAVSCSDRVLELGRVLGACDFGRPALRIRKGNARRLPLTDIVLLPVASSSPP